MVIAGNKIDQRAANEQPLDAKALDKFYMPLMSQFKEIETCIECSAKEVLNVAEVFYFASKAVLHPSQPLVDTSTQKLKEKPLRALERIFNVCDRNKDGLLDDAELNAFQVMSL